MEIGFLLARNDCLQELCKASNTVWVYCVAPGIKRERSMEMAMCGIGRNCGKRAEVLMLMLGFKEQWNSSLYRTICVGVMFSRGRVDMS